MDEKESNYNKMLEMKNTIIEIKKALDSFINRHRQMGYESVNLKTGQ